MNGVLKAVTESIQAGAVATALAKCMKLSGTQTPIGSLTLSSGSNYTSILPISALSTNTAGSLSSPTLSTTIAFSLGGSRKNALLAQTAIQLSLATLDQGAQTYTVPITSLHKLCSYYSYLGFLGNVRCDMQTQLSNCITSNVLRLSLQCGTVTRDVPPWTHQV